jgi:hypothetical protein
MAAQRYSFDVQTRQGSRWVIDCVETQEHLARKRAAALFTNPKCAGARIIRTWTRPDGVPVDTEIFCQTREVEQDTTLKITKVDAAEPKCETLEDFLGAESRQTMARIFRAYITKFVATPTEILYDPRHLKRISEADGLLRDAVDMVATLQTRNGEQDSRSRSDEIFKVVDGIFEQARAIDQDKLPKIEGKFSDVKRSLGPAIDRARARTLMLAALARDLGKFPSWFGKLEMLCGLAEAETEPEALEMLDGVIADVLATDVMDDIIGVPPSLGARIRVLFDLADGIMPTARTLDAEVTERLCKLLAGGKLPGSRRCVSGRAHRALRMTLPLKPNDPEQELPELKKIIARVLSPTGLHSGADTAFALTIRFTRMVEQGGKAGRRAAIRGVFDSMPDMARGVIYLCDAARCDLAQDHLLDMEEVLDLVLKVKVIDDFCSKELDIKQRMACATAAFHAIAASPFSPLIRARLAAHIDNLLDDYVIGERIIEKLDQPHSHLRDRAFRLIRFCCSGLLPDGKALTKARGRVLTMLKQTDFTTRFVAGIDDPEAAQKALRDFFALLKSSGVQGG